MSRLATEILGPVLDVSRGLAVCNFYAPQLIYKVALMPCFSNKNK